MSYKYLLTTLLIFNVATVALAADVNAQNNPSAAQTNVPQENIPSKTTQQGTKENSLSKDIILVLDNSGSMKQNDPEFFMKDTIKKFIANIDESSRLGITIFDQKIQKTVPLMDISSRSKKFILESLSKINYQGSRTNSPDAIESAIYDMKNNAREDALKIIIFLTDGIIDTGDLQRDSEKRKWLQDYLANDASDSGIKIFSIAFSEDANFELIQSLAQKTGGEYYRVLTASNLENVFKKMYAKMDKPRPLAVKTPEVTEKVEKVGKAAKIETVETVETVEKVKIIEKIVEKPIPNTTPAATPGQPSKYFFAQYLSMQNILIVILVILLLVALAVTIAWRRSPNQGSNNVVYPEAYLYYSHDTQMEKCMLDTRALMLGRIGGNNTNDVKYLVIPEKTIGRHHAVIEYKDFGYWIIDQASINGTFVNDKKVLTEKKLQHNDIIRLHGTELLFMMPEMGDEGMTVVSKSPYTPQGPMTGSEVTLMPQKEQPKESHS